MWSNVGARMIILSCIWEVVASLCRRRVSCCTLILCVRYESADGMRNGGSFSGAKYFIFLGTIFLKWLQISSRERERYFVED